MKTSKSFAETGLSASLLLRMVLAMLASWLAASAAGAAPQSARDTLLQQSLKDARRLLSARSFTLAFYTYARAHAVSREPALHLQLAHAAHRADRMNEALLLYELLADRYPSAAERGEAATRATTLRPLLVEDAVDAAEIFTTYERAGREHFKAGRFALAGDNFAVAYALSPLPRLLFNMAQAERRADHLQPASVLYERVLQEDPQHALRAETESYLRELRPLLARPPLYRRPALWWGVSAAAVALAGLTVGLVLWQRNNELASGARLEFTLTTLH